MILQGHVPVMAPSPPTVTEAYPYLALIDESGQYSNFGPLERRLRRRFADFVEVDENHVATASNATLALAGAMAVSRAQHWLVPSFTFSATAAAVTTAGRTGEFVDVNERWWLEPPGELAPEVGMIPVSPFGSPIDLNSWPVDGEVIIDAAASLGTRPRLEGLPQSWAIVFSLHATKVLGAGEGGLVIFGDARRAEMFRQWSNFGFDSDRSSLRSGSNAKLSEIQAGYALAAVDRWPTERSEWIAARNAVQELQSGLESDLADSHPGLDDVSPYWVVRFRNAHFAGVVEATFRELDIGTRRWWGSGCHAMPAYQDWKRSPLPHTEHAASVSLGLPFFRGLGEEHVARIRTALDLARRRIGV